MAEQPPKDLPSKQFVDIAELADKQLWTGSLTSEAPSEREHRLQQATLDAQFKRWQNVALFGVTLVGLVTIVWLSINTISDPNASAEEKGWARSLVTAVVSGGVGYLVRGQSK
ncbi:MAG: hypothetical protein AAF704_14115 [Cyanobacteria bacterium P01_D01_bin.123]